MDKTLAKKTAVIAHAAKASGGMFVFATLDSNLLKSKDASSIIAKFKYLEHSCADCGTSFAAPEVASMHYNCVSCGSGKVEASQKVIKPVIASDDSLSLVNCNSCGTHNVMPKGVVASVNQLNCTACGHTMSYKSQADVDGDEDEDESDPDQDYSQDDDQDMDDQDDDMSTMDIEDESEETALFGVKAADDAQDVPSAPNGVNTNEIPSDKKLDIPSPSQAPAVAEQPGGSVAVDPPEGQPVAVDLLSEFDSKKDSELSPEGTQLSFVHIGGKFAIAAGTTVLATLSPEQAGDNAEMMYTQAFASAVAHSIKTLGLKEAAKAYNFESAKVMVNVSKEALALATAKVQDSSKMVTAKIDEVAADFQQSLDIAAAGFAQNFWRNKHDPVKAALISEFANLGIKAAAKIVDRIFANNGVAQMREVLEMARELSAGDVAGRNAIAKAINLSKYLPTQKAAAEEDKSDMEPEDEEDEDAEEASHVAAVAVSVNDSVTATTFVPSQYKSSVLASIMGNHSFNS
jgi:hypothetical protein